MSKAINWKLNLMGHFRVQFLEKAVKSLLPPSEDPEKALLGDSRSDKRLCRA